MLAALKWLTPRRLILLAALAGVLAVAIILLWYFVLRGDPPPPASLQAAVQSVLADQQQAQQAQASDADTLDAQQQASDDVTVIDADEQDYSDEPSEGVSYGSDQQPPEQQQAAQEDSAADPPSDGESTEQSRGPETQPLPELPELAGSWTLSERGESFVGYRIDEELANIGATTAVGRTGEITATLEFDGAAITAVEIVADLRTLRSDQSFRDGALRDRGLESDTYPFATFRLTEPIPIDRLPVSEDTLAVTVAGTLELHGVTNDVQIALAGQYVDGLVVVSGSTEIVLTDYEIEAPTGFRVLSIAEAGLMEFQIVFEQSP